MPFVLPCQFFVRCGAIESAVTEALYLVGREQMFQRGHYPTFSESCATRQRARRLSHRPTRFVNAQEQGDVRIADVRLHTRQCAEKRRGNATKPRKPVAHAVAPFRLLCQRSFHCRQRSMAKPMSTARCTV